MACNNDYDEGHLMWLCERCPIQPGLTSAAPLRSAWPDPCTDAKTTVPLSAQHPPHTFRQGDSTGFICKFSNRIQAKPS